MSAYLEDAVDPFDPSVQQLDPETPDLAAVMHEGMRQHGLMTRVALPAAVTAVRGNQCVDLQPLIKSLYRNGKVVDLPVIPQVPVCAPVGGAYGIKLPIAVGDTGLALFCDRSLDNWMAGSGGAVDPQDSRAHDLTDGIFLPGLVPLSGQTQDATSDLVMRNGQAVARLQPGGQIVLGNGQAELVDLTCQLANAVIALTSLIATDFFTATALGPMPPLAATIAAAQAQKATAQTLLQSLETLRGKA